MTVVPWEGLGQGGSDSWVFELCGLRLPKSPSMFTHFVLSACSRDCVKKSAELRPRGVAAALVTLEAPGLGGMHAG